MGKSFVVVAQITDRKPRSRSPSKKRRPTAVEREAQEKIDRENRILLKKILEQHHGIRRSSSIPPASALNQNHHPPKYIFEFFPPKIRFFFVFVLTEKSKLFVIISDDFHLHFLLLHNLIHFQEEK